MIAALRTSLFAIDFLSLAMPNWNDAALQMAQTAPANSAAGSSSYLWGLDRRFILRKGTIGAEVERAHRMLERFFYTYFGRFGK